ncbi:MAG TPA: glycosyltransferase family 2 protein [Candidatus Polarisedimenticolia bacterium]|nr:glycosyltransferase family 2 protein [Candidatus Polarisedimenticolia bacterium]
MIHGKRIVVVLPAYNAVRTLRQTYEELPHEIVDHVILVDDASQDETTDLARTLGIATFAHPKNLGYGGNQKTCYREALRAGADVVIMVHPDYQYTPALVTAMASMVAKGIYDTVLGSRLLGRGALKGGMPVYKYVANRILTLVENLALQRKLSEYHTGYRAFSRKVLESLPLEENSNDFVFDNEMLAQIVAFGFEIGEVSCPTRYFGEASSISFPRAVKYGMGVLGVCAKYRLHRWGLVKYRIFAPDGRKLETGDRA